ncbi:MAG: hypothetical protein WAO47_07740 [Caldicoprobacterales bacterium]
MRNTHRIFGIFVMIFFILFSMGAGVLAETQDGIIEEDEVTDVQYNEGKSQIQEEEPEEDRQEEELEEDRSEDKTVATQESEEDMTNQSQDQEQENQKSDSENHEGNLDRIDDSLLDDSSPLSSEKKLEYNSDTPVFRLDKVTSDSGKTLTALAWMYGGNTYLAVIPSKEITEVIYENNKVNINEDTIKRAETKDCKLEVNKNTYGCTDFGDNNNFNDKSRWSVIKIEGQTLISPFKLTIKVKKDKDNETGNDIVEKNVHVDRLLQVYHKYGEILVLDKAQSGLLNNQFGYRVSPQYKNEKDGIDYELVDIEVVYNGEEQTNIGISDLKDGYLEGQVPTIKLKGKGKKDEYDSASAKITFIYKQPDNVDKGSITITNILKDPENKDMDREFDFFICGPQKKIYTVSLKHEESVTLEDLQYGEYTIKEIVPMNFKNKSGNLIEVNINNHSPHISVTIENQRRNSGWFYHEDIVKTQLR